MSAIDRSRDLKQKVPIPWWRWPLWYSLLVLGLVVFYGLFTPVWFGLRSLAWLAEFRARRRNGTGAAARR